MEVIREVQSDSYARQNSAAPLMKVMKYMVPSVVTLAGLEYQGKAKSPFVDNPVPAWCFLVSICVYWLTFGAIEQMPTTTSEHMVLNRVALASGVLSAKSLFLFFCPPLFSFLLLAIWIPILPLLAWPVIKYAYNNYNLLAAGILFRNFVDKICTKVRGFRGYMEEESLPV